MPFDEQAPAKPEGNDVELVRAKLNVLSDELLRMESERGKLLKEVARVEILVQTLQDREKSLDAAVTGKEKRLAELAESVAAAQSELSIAQAATGKAVADAEAAKEEAATAKKSLSEAVVAQRAAQEAFEAEKAALVANIASFEARKKAVRDLIETI